MAAVKQQICGFCHNVVTDGTFKTIEGSTRDMLDMISLKSDIGSIICEVCSVELFEVFSFKSTCIHTENIIKTYVYATDEIALDMADIYMREMESEQFANNLEDQKVCRLCMELITGEFVLTQQIDPLVFNKCVPEIKFSFTKHPVLCKTCVDCLHKSVNFLDKCINAGKEFVKNYDDDNKTASVVNERTKIEAVEDVKSEILMESEAVVIKSENEDEDNLAQTNLKKSPQLENPNTSKRGRFQCDECHYSTPFKKYLVNHQKRHKVVPESELHKCELCGFQTRHKQSLNDHMIRHAKIDEVYKCDSCDYKAKFKPYLKKHVLVHHSPDAKLYKCKECPFQTKLKNNLQRHFLIKHGRLLVI